MMRNPMRALFLSTTLMFAASGQTSLAETIGQNITTETVSFDSTDVQATQIARQMYGREFQHVRAIRIWLEEPSNDPEQLFLELSKGRSCDLECFHIALFHNGQWLEIYRQPKAARLGLSVVKATGMKSIIADDRVWSWNASNYVPEPNKKDLKRRDASETELGVVAEQLNGGFIDSTNQAFGPPEVDVYDVEMNGYLGKIIAVRSPVICGQSTCPIFLLNAEDQIFRVLRSLEGEVGLSRRVRDEQGFRGIELLTRNGISIVSSTTGKLLSSVPVQSIRVAGRRP